MKNFPTRIWDFIFNRFFFIYFLFYLLMFHGLDQDTIQKRTLYYLNAPIGYLLEFSQGKKKFDASKFHSYLTYYKEFSSCQPQRADIQGLLGFCYYHLGNKKQAIAALKRAAELNPDFFWHAYNLGVIYFKEKDYARAVEFFAQALKADPIKTQQMIKGSSVLRTLYTSETTGKGIVENAYKSSIIVPYRLMEGYLTVYEGMILGHYYLKNYNEMFNVTQEAIGVAPNYAFFFEQAGVAAFYLGHERICFQFLKQALEKEPKGEHAAELLKLIFKKSTRASEAQVDAFMQKANESFSPQLRIY